MSSNTIPRVVPAKLSFLALYNPSLGSSDDTIQDQIVFYYSPTNVRTKGEDNSPQDERTLREEQNKRLRQVGLAQGMVGFARSFSHGDAVDAVETEKSRIVLHELEPGWWVLASIDLTQLPAAKGADQKADRDDSGPHVEYSSREVSPPALLLQQLVRAHSVFLLHHGPSLQNLFSKLGRDRFCNTLDRFWTRFATQWDVLLHGSPALDIFRGTKLAAGGELGMGVGEEEWGSGEREVLEDFARRTDGLVDLVVSRFGEPSPLHDQEVKNGSRKLPSALELEPWLGRGKHVNACDGVVFSGVGALSRRSLRDLSHWVEDIYTLGEYAYGVRDSPTADRRRRRRRDAPSTEQHDPQATPTQARSPAPQQPTSQQPPGIPPPIVKAAEASLNKASQNVESSSEAGTHAPVASLADTETWMKYLTFGYGTAWGGRGSPSGQSRPLPGSGREEERAPLITLRHVDPQPEADKTEERLREQVQRENSGYFVIGLKGPLEDEAADDEDEADWNSRIPLRTVHVELVHDIPGTPGADVDERTSYEQQPEKRKTKPKLSRLRPVVYVHRPFIYTFLFNQRTESLTLGGFYRNLHTYFSPLHRPLSDSTSPERVDVRIADASHPYTTVSATSKSGPNQQPIYNLVFDPRTLNIHSSLPNIPDPSTLVAEGLSSSSVVAGWSRAEALNVHSQILSTVASTRRSSSEIERTCKTSRGWWVVWLRLPPSSVDVATGDAASAEEDPGFKLTDLRQAFLVRRAHDSTGASSKTSGSGLGNGLWGLGRPSTNEKMGGTAAGWGPRGLGEGIGVDARRYVESVLSLSR